MHRRVVLKVVVPLTSSEPPRMAVEMGFGRLMVGWDGLLSDVSK